MHVCTISSTYMEKYRTDLASTIKAEFAGDDKRVDCFCASKNVYGLSAWVVWYYCPIARIRIVYIRSYRQELLRRIQGVEIERVCTSVALDEAALALLLLSKTPERRYLIWWRYRIEYK
ncbi:hypothetical protein PF003_g20542 [Phytophthora fragariae]|nr:hypothetical protein PF003_g20542 [Phytophthora fragariae]